VSAGAKYYWQKATFLYGEQHSNQPWCGGKDTSCEEFREFKEGWSKNLIDDAHAHGQERTL
jgi:hypothetical protein